MNYFKPSYWIAHQQAVPQEWQVALMLFFGLFIIFGVITAILAVQKRFRKPFRTLYTKLSVWSWVMGGIGFILLFTSIQRISFISARLFYPLWLIGTIWWLVAILRYGLKNVPRLIKEQDEKAAMDKYLPKRKR